MSRASKSVVIPWDQAGDAYTVPEGRYIMRITEANVGENANGDARVEIQYLVMAPAAHKGRKIRIFYSLTAAPGLRALRELLQGLGANVPNKAAALNLSSLEGKTLKCFATVATSNNGGKFQNLSEIELHGSQPEPEPEPEPDLDDLDDDLDAGLDDDLDLDLEL